MLIDLLSTMARIDNDKRIERIKQGLAGSHKGADQQRLHERIRKDLIIKQEIATIVDCGIATVYRVKI